MLLSVQSYKTTRQQIRLSKSQVDGNAHLAQISYEVDQICSEKTCKQFVVIKILHLLNRLFPCKTYKKLYQHVRHVVGDNENFVNASSLRYHSVHFCLVIINLLTLL